MINDNIENATWLENPDPDVLDVEVRDAEDFERVLGKFEIKFEGGIQEAYTKQQVELHERSRKRHKLNSGITIHNVPLEMLILDNPISGGKLATLAIKSDKSLDYWKRFDGFMPNELDS